MTDAAIREAVASAIGEKIRSGAASPWIATLSQELASVAIAAYEAELAETAQASAGADSMTDDAILTLIEQCELKVSHDELLGIARNSLANVPDTYSEDQLLDIGRRARHWVLKALKTYLSAEHAKPVYETAQAKAAAPAGSEPRAEVLYAEIMRHYRECIERGIPNGPSHQTMFSNRLKTVLDEFAARKVAARDVLLNELERSGVPETVRRARADSAPSVEAREAAMAWYRALTERDDYVNYVHNLALRLDEFAARKVAEAQRRSDDTP